jgi:hypothetical protein
MLLSAFRQRLGVTVTWRGQSYAALVDLPTRRQLKYISGGTPQNAAEPDVRTVELTPADFDGSVPQEGDTVTLDDGSGPMEFVIGRFGTTRMADIPQGYHLLVFRPAPADSATEAASGEAGAGKRKSVAPLLP